MLVRVVAHDPAWRDAFAAEAKSLARALAAVVVSIHHIGSTAIPGIAAKPVIDILLEVEDVDRLDGQAPSVAALGYESMGEYGIPGRRFLRKKDAAGRRTHHVHAFQAGSPDALRHLAFRDYLIAHPDEAQVYGVLKEQLARAHPDDIDAYMDGKDAYIKEQERRAVAWYGSARALAGAPRLIAVVRTDGLDARSYR